MKYQHPARHRLISLVSKSSHAISISPESIGRLRGFQGSSMIAGTSWIMLTDVVGTSVTRCCNGQTHTHTFAYSNMCLHMYYVCICEIYIYIYTYLCVCVYSSIYQIQHAHTHTHIYVHKQHKHASIFKTKDSWLCSSHLHITRCSPLPALLVNLAGPHWHFVTGRGAMGSMVLLGKMSSSWVSNVFNRVSLL